MTLGEKDITVPVLLVIYNRPGITQRSFDAIARVKPKIFLVAADGPRSPEESEICNQTRKVIEQVNWVSDVQTNYSDRNLGCGVRVHSAIDWALDQFEEVIILEDDCIANRSFFGYCQELLRYYRNDSRVMHISGNNFQNEAARKKYSYYFSKYTHAWGWATWRRAWKCFDWKMERWRECRDSGILRNWCDDPSEQQYWSGVFEKMHGGHRDVWDYQWNFACWSENGLAILPSVNLVSNIGHGADATHTKTRSPYLERNTSDIQFLRHPPYVFRNIEADAFTFENNYGGAARRSSNSGHANIRWVLGVITLPYRALRKVWRMILRQPGGFSRG